MMVLREGSRNDDCLLRIVEKADNIHRWTVRDVGVSVSDVVRLKNVGLIVKVGKTHEAHPINIWSVTRLPK